MSLELKVKSWLSEGKTDAEIATLVIESDESKSLDAGSIAAAIASAKKAQEIVSALAETERKEIEKKAASLAEAENQKKVSDLVDEKLKSINIDFGKFKPEKKVKSFDKTTGQIVETEISEQKSAFQDMLRSLAWGDQKSALAISLEVESDNNSIAGSTKATPSVSDVAARGGYSIPTEVNLEIFQNAWLKSVMLPLFKQDNVVYRDKIYPIMYNLSVSWMQDETTLVSEKNPTFSNPSVTMQRMGGYSSISNALIMRKGSDITSAIVAGYGSEYAKLIDLHSVCGSVTGNFASDGDMVNGIIFDSNVSKPAPYSSSLISLAKLADLKNALTETSDLTNCYFIVNRKINDKIGVLESTGGMREFPGWINGAQLAPFGIKTVVNPWIPSVLDIGLGKRTLGTDDVIVLADMSKIVAAMSDQFYIASDASVLFLQDAVAIKAIGYYGQKILTGSSTAGIAAIAQELN